MAVVVNSAEVRELQQDLNKFFTRFLSHYQPLRVDGNLGPVTRDRVRDAKFFLGYLRRNLNTNPKTTNFRWRLKHPLTVRPGRGQTKKTIDRGKARRKRDRQQASSDNLWGGSRAVTNEIIRIVERKRPGTKITSRKRSETFGNPVSDHHISQKLADAVDFARVNDQKLIDEISRELGGPRDVSDFQNFFIHRNGKKFRVQLIAGTHGTGPHTHAGVRRA